MDEYGVVVIVSPPISRIVLPSLPPSPLLFSTRHSVLTDCHPPLAIVGWKQSFPIKIMREPWGVYLCQGGRYAKLGRPNFPFLGQENGLERRDHLWWKRINWMILISGGKESMLLLNLHVKFGSPCTWISFTYIVTPSVIIRASSFDTHSSVQLPLKSENGDGARRKIWQIGLRFFSLLKLFSSQNPLIIEYL